MDRGKVVGQGTHEELIINCKVYIQMLEKEQKLSEIGDSKTAMSKDLSHIEKDNF